MSASWGFAGSDAFAPLFSPFEPVASSPSSLGVIDKLARLFPASMGRRRHFDYHRPRKTLYHESTIKVNFVTGDYAKSHKQFKSEK